MNLYLLVINKYSKMLFSYSNDNPNIYYFDYYTDKNESYEDYIEKIKTVYLTPEILEDLTNYKGIVFKTYFNSSIDELPDNIKSITMSDRGFDQPINKLPSSLEVLNFSNAYDYNNTVCNIPDTVKVIKLSKDMVIPNIPKNLEFLQFNYDLSNELYEKIRNSDKIIKLVIGCGGYQNHDCNINLKNLPNNLKILDINGIKDLDLTNLPDALVKLEVFINEADIDLDRLPSSLKILWITNNNFNSPLQNLPNNLKKLTIISHVFNNYIGCLPNNLEILELNVNSLNENSILPINLKSLTIQTRIPSTIILPPNLVYLKIHWNNLVNYENLTFPETLKALEIICFKHNDNNNSLVISYILPSGLKYLRIGDFLKFRFQNMPEELEFLLLEDGFDNENLTLPNNLKSIYINADIDLHFKINNFPENLKHIHLTKANLEDLINLPNHLESFYVKHLIINSEEYYNFPSELKFLGFYPYNKTDNNEILEKIINNVPDSVEILVLDFNLDNLNINKLPSKLKEISINDLSNDEDQIIDNFIEMGCNNDFDSIYIHIVADRTDQRDLKRALKRYFNTTEYDINYDYEYHYDSEY